MNDKFLQEHVSSMQPRWNTELEFDQAIKSAKQQLDSISGQLGKIRCPKVKSLKIKLNELSKEYIEKKIASCQFDARKGKSTDTVYIIRVDDKDASRNLCDLMRADAERQKGKKPVGYSRINDRNLPSQTLYVGRSRNMCTRLRQHLGDLLVQAIEDGLWESLKPAFGRKGSR
ncbi:hypothetical protein [Paraburkholderia sp. 22B1P]|uniref:hypothetical protein n=1 Tax=Paraburkholderia sp. 22B1P TaxID=3080498 RepID=UPI00308E5C01|nr:GIY-YIG nuclease family protein [Paraburkholderia sp. 22B1P]